MIRISTRTLVSVLLFLIFLCRESRPAGGPQGKTGVIASVIEISRVHAEPAILNCASEHAHSTIEVQAWFLKTDDTPVDSTALIELFEFSTQPAGNSIGIKVRRQRVPLKKSPAVVNFEVTCSTKTFPGFITLAAMVDEVPGGFTIQQPNPPEDGRVSLTLKD